MSIDFFWGGVIMKISKYVLQCSCIAILCCGVAMPRSTNTNPEIAKIKQRLSKLEQQANASEEADKEHEGQIQKLNEEFGKKAEEVQAAVNEVKESSEKINEQVAENKKDITAMKEANGNQADSQAKIDELSGKIDALSQNNESANEIVSLRDDIAKVQQELQTNSDADKQQNLEIAQLSAKVDKRLPNSGAQESSSSGFFNSTLVNTLAQGGLGLAQTALSGLFYQKPTSEMTNDLKEAVKTGKSTEDMTKGLTPEEREEFEALKETIKNLVASGRSDQEIQKVTQENMQNLQSKVSKRQEKEISEQAEQEKYRGLGGDYFGANEAFSTINFGETVTKIYEIALSDAAENKHNPPIAEEIISGNINQIDRDLINVIYELVQKGAGFKVIFDRVRPHVEGNPMHVPNVEPIKVTEQQPTATSETLANKPMTQQSVANNVLTAQNPPAATSTATTTAASETLANKPMTQQSVANNVLTAQNPAVSTGINNQSNNSNPKRRMSLKTLGQKVMNQLPQRPTMKFANTVKDALDAVRKGESQVLTDSNGKRIVLPNEVIDSYGKEVPASSVVVNLRDDAAKTNLAKFWLDQDKPQKPDVATTNNKATPLA